MGDARQFRSRRPRNKKFLQDGTASASRILLLTCSRQPDSARSEPIAGGRIQRAQGGSFWDFARPSKKSFEKIGERNKVDNDDADADDADDGKEVQGEARQSNGRDFNPERLESRGG